MLVIVSQFGILVSGFRPIDSTIIHLTDEKLTTPTLHILGQSDAIVSEQRSQSMVDACHDPRIEWHSGGMCQ